MEARWQIPITMKIHSKLFPFYHEFNTAVSWLANGVSIHALLSAEYPFTDLEERTFRRDKTQAAKVQLVSKKKRNNTITIYSLAGKNILITGQHRHGFLLATGLGKYGAQIIIKNCRTRRTC
ncbi:hypothetical protein QT346_17720 [Escherichia coli]|nr:hypothetical protein [Escherichia coli]